MRPDVPALWAAVILNERVLTGVLQQAALDLAERAQAVWHGSGRCEVYATHEVAVSLPNLTSDEVVWVIEPFTNSRS
jgi:hypothetical protein